MFNNLIQPNLNLSFYKETNFYTFKIKDFLNEEQYKLLNDNFPRFPRTEFKKYNSQFDNNDSEHRLKAFITEVDPKSYTEHEFRPKVIFPTIKNTFGPDIQTHIGSPERFLYSGIGIKMISEIQIN